MPREVIHVHRSLLLSLALRFDDRAISEIIRSENQAVVEIGQAGTSFLICGGDTIGICVIREPEGLFDGCAQLGIIYWIEFRERKECDFVFDGADEQRNIGRNGGSGGIEGTIDNVLGFVHSKDLLSLPPEDYDKPLPLRLIRRMLVVPRDRSLDDLLLSMRRARIHFAVVVEPNRATAGVVTLEDLLEELVGEIVDESDIDQAST